MKQEILKLKNDGLSYRQIQKRLGCSLSTISYYCGQEQKKKNRERQQRFREKNKK